MRPAATGKYAANVFTPNVIKGNSSIRHVLYRLGKQLFAIDPDGHHVLWGKVETDDCGLGCRCSAFITPDTPEGAALLATAQKIDSASNVIEAAPVSPPVKATSHVYTPAELEREARQLCKGLGRFIGWELEFMDLETGHVRLVSKFVRSFNPLRPVEQQAIERVTMVL